MSNVRVMRRVNEPAILGLPSQLEVGDSVRMVDVTLSKEKVLQAVEPRFERFELTLKWFTTTALPGFSGATASDLVEVGRGNEVLEYIASVDAGAHA